MIPRNSSRLADAGVFAALVLTALALYWPIFDIRPLVDDNLYALAWVDASPPSALPAGDAYYYPEWRPLAYTTIWIEHRLAGLDRPYVHHAVNLAIWIVCAALAGAIVRRVTGSRAAGVIVSLFLLSDPRVVWALTLVIERQSLLACAFGLGAWYLMADCPDHLTRSRCVMVASLLLASALSKEHGLAFAAGIGAAALTSRHRAIVLSAGSALAAYALLRVVLAGGAFGRSCAHTFVFFEERMLCTGQTAPADIAQMLYNIMATTLNLVVSGLFSEVGEPVLARRSLIVAAIVVVSGALALRRVTATTRSALLVIAFSGLLGAPVYHARNQLIGAAAALIIAGAGMAVAAAAAPGWGRRGALAIVLAALLLQASMAQRAVAGQSDDVNHNDPCETEIYRELPWTRPFVRRVKQHYALSDPACLSQP